MVVTRRQIANGDSLTESIILLSGLAVGQKTLATGKNIEVITRTALFLDGQQVEYIIGTEHPLEIFLEDRGVELDFTVSYPFAVIFFDPNDRQRWFAFLVNLEDSQNVLYYLVSGKYLDIQIASDLLQALFSGFQIY